MIKGVYSDIHHALKSNIKGDTDILFDHNVIQSAIENVWGTIQGERVFRRGFGSRLEWQLFEPLDVVTLLNVQTELIDSLIRSKETRVSVKINTGINEKEQLIQVNTMFSSPEFDKQVGEFTTELERD